MDVTEARVLIEIFRQQAAAKRHEIAMAIAFDRLDEEHSRRERHEKEERERVEQLTEASAAQVAAFRDMLDTYDTATVRALMDNQKALDDVRERREAMEAAAHRLPDGRMVFKTEDGKRVFGGDGVEFSHDIVIPIPFQMPRRIGTPTGATERPSAPCCGIASSSTHTSTGWTKPARPSTRVMFPLTRLRRWTPTCERPCRTP